MKWDVEKIWPGKTCFIIGGGYSIKRLKLETLQHENLIVVNNAFKLFPQAAFCVFMDKEWWPKYKGQVNGFDGKFVTVHQSLKDFPELLYVQRGAALGLSQNPNMLRNGNNSGHIALNLACLLGVKKVYLVGFDMRVVNNQHNYHTEHTRSMPDDIYSKQYIKNFRSTLVDLKTMGVTVFNATPDSALTCFPFADDVIERIYAEHNLRS